MTTNHHNLTQQIYTRKMLLAAGNTPRKIGRLVTEKKLLKLRKNIYIDNSSYLKLLPSQKAFAQIYALYLFAPSTIFSHYSAASLHGLPLISWDGATHILTSYGSNTNIAGVKKHVKANLENFRGYFSPENIQCTYPLQTILDCAQTGSLEQAVALADAATYRGLVHPDTLKEQLLATTGRGSQKAQAVAKLFDPQCESVGETLTRLAISQAGLPLPVPQYWVEAHGYNYRLDFAYPHLKIAIEFDGQMKYSHFGSASSAVLKERQREKHLHNAGWRVIRVDWETITRRPEVFIADLTRVLAS